MIVNQLCIQLLIISSSVPFQYLTSVESTSCSTCMADIYGPYPENQTITNVAMVRATESDPAVIICRYRCYDQHYNFYLGIDILDPKLRRQIRRTIGSEHRETKYNFTVVPSSIQTCDLSNIIETVRRYRIQIGSSDTPTLIAKCFVAYSPNGISSSVRCSNSSTLAVIPGYSTPDHDPDSLSSNSLPQPSKTASSPPSCMLSTVNHYLTETVTVTVNNITATPQSIPTPSLSGNRADCGTKSDSTNLAQCHAIIWPVLAVLIAIFLMLSIMVYVCTKSEKCQFSRCKDTLRKSTTKVQQAPNPGNTNDTAAMLW